MEKILNVLEDKLKEQELSIFCRDLEIERKDKEIAELREELKMTQEALADAEAIIRSRDEAHAEGGH